MRELKLYLMVSAVAGAIIFILSASVVSAGDTYVPLASVWSVWADAFDDFWYWLIFFSVSLFFALLARRFHKGMLFIHGGGRFT
jgi:hypothetical protein